jgi:hypothetical protein
MMPAAAAGIGCKNLVHMGNYKFGNILIHREEPCFGGEYINIKRKCGSDDDVCHTF